MKKVVIVESPSKAKTIGKYLGKEYVLLASYGHVRDLPSKNGSVDPDNQFKMMWEVDERSQGHISEIARAVKDAEEVYLATDPDREGEAISWHILEILKEKKALKMQKVQRIVFHEITKTAVQNALTHPREINAQLVDAYLARRALDYLVGFTLSPVLWRKLPGSKSAGRVQSVALRMIVDRENEIERFTSQEYWSVSGAFKTKNNSPFTARLTHLANKKLEKFDLTCAADAQDACDQVRAGTFTVEKVDKKTVRRNPAAPFITSTLQQEASRKLGFGASRTMQVAQKLYEGINIGGETTGLITYMRTDSVVIAQEALQSIRGYIGDFFGADYLPAAPRTFKNKAKNAQEAHEAIRPTDIRRTPKDMAAYLDEGQMRLYELIWKRTVASQMENAIFDQVSIDLSSSKPPVVMRATGSTLVFDGFLKLYQEGVDNKIADEDEEGLLPAMTVGDAVALQDVTPAQHFTQPPPRFSEASLVKNMEELGIGRPSTYASIIQVLQNRQYVRLEKKQFIPEERGRLVTSFLLNFFKTYVEYDFTAQLEEQLDDISQGQLGWTHVLQQFWGAFYETIEKAKLLDIPQVLEQLEKDLTFHLFQGEEDAKRRCPSCKKGKVGLKLSRFGAFLGCDQYPDCRYTRRLMADGGDGDDTPLGEEPKILGVDPMTQAAITLRKGPYGHYVQWDLPSDQIEQPEFTVESEEKPKKRGKKAAEKPKRVSIPSGLDPASVTLDMVMRLAALPRSIGQHPESAFPLTVNTGRFGPYVRYGEKDFVSIPKKGYDMFTITLEEAMTLIEQKKNRPPRAAGRSASTRAPKATKEASEKKVTTKAAAKPKIPKAPKKTEGKTLAKKKAKKE